MADVVAYIRASTDEQELSIEVQRAALARWCSQEGHTIASIHVDDGVGGGTPIDERPGLLAALSAVDRGNIFAIHKRDRLARDYIVAGMVDRIVQRSGATSHTIEGVPNDDTPEGALLRSIVDVFAQYERMLIKARTKQALAIKKARGERVGHIPYGQGLGEDGRTLVNAPAERKTIALICRLRDRGESFRKIRDTLARRKVLNRTGKPFGIASIHGIISRNKRTPKK